VRCNAAISHWPLSWLHPISLTAHSSYRKYETRDNARNEPADISIRYTGRCAASTLIFIQITANLESIVIRRWLLPRCLRSSREFFIYSRCSTRENPNECFYIAYMNIEYLNTGRFVE